MAENELRTVASKVAAREVLSATLAKKFKDYANDRRPLETVWMKNLRQYLGQYDPDVKDKIPEDRSSVYPKDTRARIHGFVAKMMEMMFPASDQNWMLAPSPIPTISQEQQDNIINALVEEAMMAAQQASQQAGQPVPPQPLSTETIEQAIKEFAEERAVEMSKLCSDQLKEIEYVQFVKRVVRSGGIYGWGILKGPETRKQKERVWEFDEEQESYMPKIKMQRRPNYLFKKIWDVYPDLAAPEWSKQEGLFERIVLSRHALKKLTKRNDFYKGVIEEWLKLNPDGNYTEQPFETELDVHANKTNIADKKSRKYEIIRWVGYITGQMLYDMGIEMKEDLRIEDVFADIWMLDNKIIKADLSPFGEAPADLFHIFVYGDDEESGLTGVGMPIDIRDTQISIAAAARMLMDNSSAVAGPIFEVNEELLSRGKDIGSIHSFMTIYREGLGSEASAPAVRQLKTDSHINEILQILNMLRQQMDIETNLPAWMLGNGQNLGEAFRTSRNMSVMSGGANLIMKDVVRQFDRFTTSVIRSLYRFNMEFGPEFAKGDFHVIPRGVESLVAKEVRGAALDQFWATASPEERALLKTREVLMERLKARDLDTGLVYDEARSEQILQSMRDAQAQAAQVQQGLDQAKTEKTMADAEKAKAQTQEILAKLEAGIGEIMSRVEANLANAKAAGDKTELEQTKVLLDSVMGAVQNAQAEAGVQGVQQNVQ